MTPTFRAGPCSRRRSTRFVLQVSVAVGRGNLTVQLSGARIRLPDGHFSVEDPRAHDIRSLLGRHLVFARSQTPPEDAHALDLAGLLDPSVTFFSFRADGKLLAIGALKHLDN